MKIGDQIQIQIPGGESGVTLGDPGSGSIFIGPGSSVNVSGIIIADLGNKWRVKINTKIGGKDILIISK